MRKTRQVKKVKYYENTHRFVFDELSNNNPTEICKRTALAGRIRLYINDKIFILLFKGLNSGILI